MVCKNNSRYYRPKFEISVILVWSHIAQLWFESGKGEMQMQMWICAAVTRRGYSVHACESSHHRVFFFLFFYVCMLQEIKGQRIDKKRSEMVISRWRFKSLCYLQRTWTPTRPSRPRVGRWLRSKPGRRYDGYNCGRESGEGMKKKKGQDKRN